MKRATSDKGAKCAKWVPEVLMTLFGGRRTYVCDARCAWVDWIDQLQRSGEISSELASRATLD